MPIYTADSSGQRDGPTETQRIAGKEADKVAPLTAADNGSRRAASAADSELKTELAKERVTASKRRDTQPAKEPAGTIFAQSRRTRPVPISGPSGTQPTFTGTGAPWSLAGGGTRQSWLRRNGEELADSDDDNKPHW
jgi:hypothetical protein